MFIKLYYRKLKIATAANASSFIIAKNLIQGKSVPESAEAVKEYFKPEAEMFKKTGKITKDTLKGIKNTCNEHPHITKGVKAAVCINAPVLTPVLFGKEILSVATKTTKSCQQ